MLHINLSRLPASQCEIRTNSVAEKIPVTHAVEKNSQGAMRTNQDYFVHKKPCGGTGQGGEGDWLAHAVSDLPRAELDKLLDCPDALLWSNLDRPVKLGHSSVMVRAALRLDDGPQAVAYKRTRAKNRAKAFLNLFRSSRAMRGWRLGHALLARGIATPRPIVVCEPGLANRLSISQAWQERAAYLATQWVDGAENLHLWAWALSERPPHARMKLAAECALSLGRLVGRMHARQISHGDLKGSNVLVVDRRTTDKAEMPDTPEMPDAPEMLDTLLIDLDGVRIHKRLLRKRRVADLMRLATSVAGHPWVNNSLRRRFLAAYAAEFPRGAVCWKTLWREVARKSGKLIAKKRKRGDAIL